MLLIFPAQCAINRQEYFADRLEKAMKGIGTDEGSLIRVIVSRSEVRESLVFINQHYLMGNQVCLVL